MTGSGGVSPGGSGGQGGTGATMGGAAGRGTGGAAGISGGAGASGDMHWVGTWAAGQQTTETDNLPPSPGLANNTLRQMIHVSIGGSQLRLRISNEYGTAAVTLNAVHIAKATSGSVIDTSSDKALTFNGMANVTIPAKMAVNTDPFDFSLTPLENVDVTIAFGTQSGDVTGHPGSRTTSYIQSGNHVSDATVSGSNADHWYFISALDVMAPASTGAIAILGDSITDGRGSTTNMNDRWPDDLSKKLQGSPTTSNVAVLNLGIGGNCVVSGGLGPTATSRFDNQILGQSGVKWVMVLEGVNDIAANVTTSQLTSAFQSFIDKSHQKNLKIYGIPILPFAGTSNSGYDTTAHQQVRTDTNTWIRAAGHFDQSVPLDAAVEDTSNPPKLQSAYDSGDGLHLNPAGYQKMADTIDLSLFQ